MVEVALEDDDAAARADERAEARGLAKRHLSRGDAEARQDLAHEARRAAVERRARQHLVPRLDEREQRGRHGGHAGSERQGGCAAFEGGERRLQLANRGVLVAGIEAKLLVSRQIAAHRVAHREDGGGPATGLPQAGESQRSVRFRAHVVRLLACAGRLPLVKAVRHDQAAPLAKSFPESRLGVDRLGASIAHPASDGWIVGPKRNQSPRQPGRFAMG
jgi:hypothetical protein